MGLSAEEKKQLEELTKKSKEPDAPRGGINFTLDLGSDVGWERAKKLGLVPGEDNDDGDGDDDGDEPDDAPRRRGGYFSN